MNKLKIKFVISTCPLLILPNFQVFSQNQHLYHFVINNKEQQAKIALVILVKEELHGRHKPLFSQRNLFRSNTIHTTKQNRISKERKRF